MIVNRRTLPSLPSHPPRRAAHRHVIRREYVVFAPTAAELDAAAVMALRDPRRFLAVHRRRRHALLRTSDPKTTDAGKSLLFLASRNVQGLSERWGFFSNRLTLPLMATRSSKSTKQMGSSADSRIWRSPGGPLAGFSYPQQPPAPINNKHQLLFDDQKLLIFRFPITP